MEINLSEYDEIWGEQKEEVNASKTVGPGKYNVKIDVCRWRENKYTGDPQLAFCFKVIDGKDKGASIWKNCDLSKDRPQSVKFLRSDLMKLGWEGDAISDLKATDIFLGMKLEVAVVNKVAKNGKTYPNVWINKILKDTVGSALDPLTRQDVVQDPEDRPF